MGLEDIVGRATSSVGNFFSRAGKAGASYVKREFTHEVIDTLVTGAFAFAGGYIGYSVGGYLPTFIGVGIGTMLGKLFTLPFDIYYNIKSGVTAAKEVAGVEEKGKESSEPYHGPPAVAPQPAGAH